MTEKQELSFEEMEIINGGASFVSEQVRKIANEIKGKSKPEETKKDKFQTLENEILGNKL